jgi:hypothetical protein
VLGDLERLDDHVEHAAPSSVTEPLDEPDLIVVPLPSRNYIRE